MRHGYKAWAERVALEQRKLLHLTGNAPLPARLLAEQLEIPVLSPTEILGITPDILARLLQVDIQSWSAITLPTKDVTLIIYNPNHSPRRQESDLMHELAHVLCEHPPAQLVQIDPSFPPLRSYDEAQEEEAIWLGGCLQIPRDALLWAIRRGMGEAKIETHFCASNEIVRYRRQVTGVDKQMGRYLS